MSAMADDETRLDRRQVERIIARAVGNSSPLGDETLAIEDVRRIAAELDIPLEALDAAVVAELAGSPMRDLDAGGWVPAAIETSRAVAGRPADVRARTHAWLGRQEGLRLRRADGPLEVWEKDPSLIASFRSALKLRAGSGRLREFGDVRVVVGGVGERSSVSLGTRVTAPRATASIVSAVGVTGSLVATAIAAATFGWGWFLLGLPLMVLSVVAGVAAGRAVANSMRDGLERALDGIEQGAPPPVDSVGDVIGDLRQAVETKRPPTPKSGQARKVDIRWE
jgi:hypothetical protein